MLAQIFSNRQPRMCNAVLSESLLIQTAPSPLSRSRPGGAGYGGQDRT